LAASTATPLKTSVTSTTAVAGWGFGRAVMWAEVVEASRGTVSS
jgi:hypothetical protein